MKGKIKMKKLFALIYLLLAFVGRVQSQEIFEVIKANDFETVKTIISDNPLVKDQLDARGRTVLFYAIDAKNIEILNYLIVSQVNMNTKDVLGRTPLMYSLFSTDKDTRFARALILAGAKIDEKDSFGYTALEYAAQAGSKKIVELLIEKNIIIPIDPPNGNRLLHFSVQNGLRNLMKILVEKGVSTKISGLLHSAATNGQDEIIKDLLNLRININQVSQGWTPLHIASYNGKISTIELLLENGLCISPVKQKGRILFQKLIK
jgi:ankyrin repeat protein